MVGPEASWIIDSTNHPAVPRALVPHGTGAGSIARCSAPDLLHVPRSPRSSLRHALRPAPLAPAVALALAAEAPLELRTTGELQPLPRGEATRTLPIILRARELRGRPDLETLAEGDAEFRRGGLVIRADRLSYDHPDDLALARGHVRISRDGNVYSGPELQLHVQRFEGFFLEPSYFFGRTGAGGTARRIDFLDEQRAVAQQLTVDFARKLSATVDALGQECGCVIVNKAALLGGVAIDYTDQVRARIR